MPSLHAHMVPDATLATGFWTVVGAGSISAALADASDATYASQTLGGSGSGYFTVALADPSPLPANSQVRFIRFILSTSQSPAGYGPLRADLVVPGVGAIATAWGPLAGSPSGASVDLGSRPGGGEWTFSDLQSLQINVIGPSSGVITNVYAMAVQVWINHSPTATPTGPGTVTTTSYPILPWTYSDADSEPQAFYEVNIFNGATSVPDPGDQGSSRFEAGTGTAPGDYTDVQAPAMRNGSYLWTVRVRESGGTVWGPWAQQPFTVTLPVPNPPVVVVTPDPTFARYLIYIFSGGGSYAPESYQIERSDDSGVTWRLCRGASALEVAGPTQYQDVEAPRMARLSTVAVTSSIGYNEAGIGYNAALGYNETVVTPATGPANVVRYRVSASRTFSGETIWSDWTTVMPASLVGNGTTWLKAPLSPQLNMVVSHLANWESVSEEDFAALRASGRADWTVFGGLPSLESGDIDLILPGDAARDAFEAIRAASADGQSILMQTCFGDTVLEQHWVRFGPNRSVVRVTHFGQNTQQYRRVKVGFHETVRVPVTA